MFKKVITKVHNHACTHQSLIFRIIISIEEERHDEDSETDKWSDYVDDLWSHEKLEHLQEMATTVDYTQVYDPVKCAYGFDNETEDYKDEESMGRYDTTTEHKESPQLSQPQTITETPPLNSLAPPGTISDTDLSVAAGSITSKDISGYLFFLKLDHHVGHFLENEIDGNAMYDIDDETLKLLGVGILKDRIKIRTQFKQWLRKKVAGM